MKKIEVIHQWQSVGEVSPKLLEGRAFENCKKVGVTSLQSYVYWAEIEKRKGEIDFSTYDELVDRLKKHGLKWTPFLILGPQYATPEWFQKSEGSVCAKCLEHGKETMIQSIWNPSLPEQVDRFLRIFSEHYSRKKVLGSILLGISGNWGESLYPATGGFNQPKDFHTHPGWWCGDDHAREDFQDFVKKKYRSIKSLNEAWCVNLSDFSEVKYPRAAPRFVHWYAGAMKNLTKFGVRTLARKADFWDRVSIGAIRLKYPSFKNKNSHRHWLDFVKWYENAMTRWAGFWLKTARKYFPRNEIYLAVGGDGNAILGADFSEQAEVAAKNGAGVRITNQEDDYVKTFVLSRWISSACRFYGTRYATEEAWHSLPEGITARVFEAATSGASAIYFKDLISEDIDAKWTQYPDVGEPTECAARFSKSADFITGENPKIEIAVLLPETSFAIDPLILSSIYSKSMKLRDVLDFDYVDEKMIGDGALKTYRFLIQLDGNLVIPETLKEIEKWVARGGVFIGDQIRDTGNKESEMFGPEVHLSKVKQGYFVRIGGGAPDFLRDVVYNKGGDYPWRGLAEIDGEVDGVYATLFKDRILYYNATATKKTKSIEISNPPKRLRKTLELPPQSISKVDLKS